MKLTETQLIDKLREICEKESQKAVAERVGYSQQIINDILKGRRNISKGIARKLGYVMDVQTTTVRTYTPIL